MLMSMQTLPPGTVLFWVEAHSKESNKILEADLHQSKYFYGICWSFPAESNKSLMKKKGFAFVVGLFQVRIYY